MASTYPLLNMKRIMTALALAGACFTLAPTAHAVLVNGGFETGSLGPWSTLGSVSISTGVNYGVAGTVTPDSGTYAALIDSNPITAAGLAAQMGISEATLEASNGGVNATNGALLFQSTAANAGDTFQFRWNFVEQDYLPFDDWAFYGIQFNGGPTTVTKFASLGTVGPGSGTTINGWTTLNVNITQTGNYTFYFGIVNAVDTQLDSRLWIDGVYAQQNVPGVPEGGSTLALLGLALGGLRFLRRKIA